MATRLSGRKPLFSSQEEGNLGVDHVVILREPTTSQFDVACKLVQDGVEFSAAFVAGQSENFRGHHGRSWTASLGNVHVTVLLQPTETGELPGPSLVAIPSVAVCDVLDEAPVPRATIKWVNDVLLEDAKVAGVLTHSSFQGDQIAAVVYGVGLNVEKTPVIDKDPAVPTATSVSEYSSHVTLSDYVAPTIRALCTRTLNWAHSAEESALDSYRRRSAIVGRTVDVIEDPTPSTKHFIDPTFEPRVLRTGRVTHIDKRLQVYLDDNHPTPVRAGRLRFNKPES